MSRSGYAEQLQNLPNVSTTIADAIAEMIFDGQLCPGKRLVQDELAEQFGVSRVPVRDALKLLEQRGHVVSVPRKGVVVRPVSRQAVRELFALRRILEPIALDEIVQNMTPTDIARLEEIVDQQQEAVSQRDMAAAMRLDQRFHSYLNGLPQNSLLKEIIQALWVRNRQFRTVMQVSPRGLKHGANSVARHRELITSLRERDSDRAKAQAIEAMNVAERDMLAELEQLGWIESPIQP